MATLRVVPDHPAEGAGVGATKLRGSSTSFPTLDGHSVPSSAVADHIATLRYLQRPLSLIDECQPTARPSAIAISSGNHSKLALLPRPGVRTSRMPSLRRTAKMRLAV